MASFFHDESRLNEFARRAQEQSEQQHKALSGPDACLVDVLEWPPSSFTVPPTLTLSVPQLLARGTEPRLRIIFAPLDRPSCEGAAGLQSIFRHYEIPSDFLSQRLQSVTHSFGAFSGQNSHTSWFNFLCKEVTVERPEGMKPRIADPRGTPYSHGDWLWIRSSFFLKWNDCDDRDKATATLIVFSASPELRARFESLFLNPDWTIALVDPFSLYVIVLDELWLQADGIMRKVAEVFNGMETTALDFASGSNSAHSRDFVGMHNMAKHIIYLKEAAEATFSMSQRILTHHGGVLLSHPPQPGDDTRRTMQRVHQMLAQKMTQFESWKIRMESMQKRMENVINLSFNMVTQQDSRVILSHSEVMKGIAAVTMFFLPATTIATIFGCQFFSSNPQNNSLEVSKDFWMYWCLAIPLSAAVFLLYSTWPFAWLVRMNERRIMKVKESWNNAHGGGAV